MAQCVGGCIDIRVNERDWKLPFAAGNASYPIPQIF